MRVENAVAFVVGHFHPLHSLCPNHHLSLTHSLTHFYAGIRPEGQTEGARFATDRKEGRARCQACGTLPGPHVPGCRNKRLFSAVICPFPKNSHSLHDLFRNQGTQLGWGHTCIGLAIQHTRACACVFVRVCVFQCVRAWINQATMA